MVSTEKKIGGLALYIVFIIQQNNRLENNLFIMPDIEKKIKSTGNNYMRINRCF